MAPAAFVLTPNIRADSGHSRESQMTPKALTAGLEGPGRIPGVSIRYQPIAHNDKGPDDPMDLSWGIRGNVNAVPR